MSGDGAGAATTLNAAGSAWSEHAGGTSGALWGAVLTAFGAVLGDEDPAGEDTIRRASRTALDAVTRLGGASVGDKTMVDAMDPSSRPSSPRLIRCRRCGNQPVTLPTWQLRRPPR
ncbi:dihydroxyacetone kinase [Cutibacterium acnes JCM 18909]|nr:dihydroxyacetone kinase [Cutibacterium acnes JCM 18909]